MEVRMLREYVCNCPCHWNEETWDPLPSVKVAYREIPDGWSLRSVEAPETRSNPTGRTIEWYCPDCTAKEHNYGDRVR
jgi:hypothetical protein